MDVSRIAINKMVGQARQPNTPNFVPAPDTESMHLATVTKIDPGRNEIAVTLNEFGPPTASGVPVRQQGGVLTMPAVGDVVQLRYSGKGLEMVGRQVRPTGVVTF